MSWELAVIGIAWFFLASGTRHVPGNSDKSTVLGTRQQRKKHTIQSSQSNHNNPGTRYVKKQPINENYNVLGTLSQNQRDAIQALRSLGYNKTTAINKIRELDSNLTVEQLIKQGLQ